MPKPLYIFDIDGTLCNIEHRLHFLNSKGDKGRWNKFYQACVNDIPNKPVINVMQSLGSCASEIWLFSGRSEDVREETIWWLCQNTMFSPKQFADNPNLLTMRPSGDYTEDHLLKQSWLQGMLQNDRDRLVGVFDDRKRVVDMWRLNGVTCFQVAEGEF